MSKKLYVGNLPYEATADSLKEAFSACGAVDSAIVISDKFSGRSKGFGFVEMASDEEAASAIESMNGKELGGRNITVSEARPMEDRPRDGGNRGGGFNRGGFNR